MNPVRTFDEISKEILNNYQEDDVITLGVLIADGNQYEAKQYIVNYMDRFDQRSGKYIDFYIPGYYANICDEKNEIYNRYHPNSYLKWENISDSVAFTIRRNNTRYYFDRMLFEDFLIDIEKRMGIEYTYNPMLVLVEVKKSCCREQLEFQRKLVIELDEDTNRGLRRSGQLFDEIFEYAKRHVHLDEIRNGVRLYYIKGNAVENIISALQGNWIDSVADAVGDVFRFRVK